MPNSNVIYLRKWHEKTSPVSESSDYFEPRNSYASTRETLELLQAFSQIENARVRSTIISLAGHDAASANPSEPPKHSA